MLAWRSVLGIHSFSVCQQVLQEPLCIKARYLHDLQQKRFHGHKE